MPFRRFLPQIGLRPEFKWPSTAGQSRRLTSAAKLLRKVTQSLKPEWVDKSDAAQRNPCHDELV
ncbi:hypothetical protein BH20ACI3_BH20ACI3_21670 [soil metagenome]